MLETLEEAVAARIIEELPQAVGQYQFTHALIRETLYDELTIARRVRLHRRTGEVLEALYRHNVEPHHRMKPLAAQVQTMQAYPNDLSPREVDVLRLLAVGKSNREIADLLFISLNTVATHVRNILTKTNSANRTEAATYALRHGLTSPPPPEAKHDPAVPRP